jgi:RNA polymerase sigma-70 factor (ECF subfamily)
MSRTRPEKSEDDVIAQLAPLRRYARALTRDETQAEDLVHDALVRAYERRTTFRAGANLRTWLLSILHNTFIDGRRQRGAELRREAETIHLAEITAPADQESSVRLQQIGRAFLTLPDEQRAVLHLVAIEGLPLQRGRKCAWYPGWHLDVALGASPSGVACVRGD